MRTFEIIIPVFLAAYFVSQLSGSKPGFAKYLPSAAMAANLLHLWLEGSRWQMYPIYLVTLLTFLISLRNLRSVNEKTLKKSSKIISVLMVVILAVISSIPALLPVPTVAKPSGKYPVGTKTYVLVDTSRNEIYSGKTEPRKFMAQVWYPGMQPAAGMKPAYWMPEAKIVAPAIADYILLPHFFLDHLELAKSSAYENLSPDVKDGPYPVLIFSHGWNGFRQQSTFLMQELASHGYIVIALEHPYGARLTVFPDGSIIPNDPDALPKGKPDAEYEATGRILVGEWTGDLSFALDYFSGLNQNDPDNIFTGMLDMNNVGAFGHSTGGGAAIQFCKEDERCKAGVGLDAFMRPVSLDVLKNGTKQPFLYLFSELWPFERNTILFDQYYSHVSPANHILTILGADHYDFSDLPALSPLAPQLGLKGPIDGARVQKIIDTYVLAFFDQQLKGIKTGLFDQSQAEYPDVRYDR